MDINVEELSASDQRRVKICLICKGDAETYHLNYGASACLSCRAFFRRSIQKSRNPQFFCKGNNNCEVTVKTRRRCQKCRYDLCVKAGMKADCVLDDGQKKQRFRKMIRKQKKTGVVEEEEERLTFPKRNRKRDGSEEGNDENSGRKLPKVEGEEFNPYGSPDPMGPPPSPFNSHSHHQLALLQQQRQQLARMRQQQQQYLYQQQEQLRKHGGGHFEYMQPPEGQPKQEPQKVALPYRTGYGQMLPPVRTTTPMGPPPSPSPSPMGPPQSPMGPPPSPSPSPVQMNNHPAQYNRHQFGRPQQQSPFEPKLGTYSPQQQKLGQYSSQQPKMGQYSSQQLKMDPYSPQEPSLGSYRPQEPKMGTYSQENKMGQYRQEAKMGHYGPQQTNAPFSPAPSSPHFNPQFSPESRRAQYSPEPKMGQQPYSVEPRNAQYSPEPQGVAYSPRNPQYSPEPVQSPYIQYNQRPGGQYSPEPQSVQPSPVMVNDVERQSPPESPLDFALTPQEQQKIMMSISPEPQQVDDLINAVTTMAETMAQEMSPVNTVSQTMASENSTGMNMTQARRPMMPMAQSMGQAMSPASGSFANGAQSYNNRMYTHSPPQQENQVPAASGGSTDSSSTWPKQEQDLMPAPPMPPPPGRQSRSAERPRGVLGEVRDSSNERATKDRSRSNSREAKKETDEAMRKSLTPVPDSPYLDLEEKEEGLELPTYGLGAIKFRKRMTKQLQRTKRTWDFACKRMLSNSSFIENLVSCHLGTNSLTKNQLKKHLIRIARLFKEFALLQPDFVEMSASDQRQLLVRNAPTFIQYILGRYLTAETPLDQVNWLLLGCQGERDHTKLPLHRISFDQLDKANNLLPDENSKAEYAFHCQTMDSYKCGLKEVPFVALFCLYQQSFSAMLDDPVALANNVSNVKTFISWCNEVFGSVTPDTVEELTGVSESMAKLFEREIVWGDNPDSGYVQLLKHELNLPYTVEEDFWLAEKFDSFTETFHKISHGQEIVEASLMYNHDRPLDKDFGSKVLNTMVQRMKAVVMGHPEVRDLPAADLARLWDVNVTDAVSVCMAKQENFATGYEQYRFSLGLIDMELLGGEYFNIFEGVTLKKTTLKIVNRDAKVLDDKTVERFCELVQRMRPFVSNMDDFKLFALIVLFSNLDVNVPAVARLQQRYLRYFQVRHAQKEDDEQAAAGRFEVALREVKEMSAILKRMGSK